jgi:hypothetical protein
MFFIKIRCDFTCQRGSVVNSSARRQCRCRCRCAPCPSLTCALWKFVSLPATTKKHLSISIKNLLSDVDKLQTLIDIFLQFIDILSRSDGASVSALQRGIVEVKQRWLVIGWVTNNLLSRVPPYFGMHVKPHWPAWWVIVRSPYDV